MLMDWGQFLAHDITGTPVGKSASWRGRRGGWGSCLHSRSFDAWVGWDRIFIPGALTGGWVGGDRILISGALTGGWVGGW